MIQSKREQDVDIWGVQGYAGRGRLWEKATLQQGQLFNIKQEELSQSLFTRSRPHLYQNTYLTPSNQSKLPFININMIIVLFTINSKDMVFIYWASMGVTHTHTNLHVLAYFLYMMKSKILTSVQCQCYRSESKVSNWDKALILEYTWEQQKQT